MSTLRQLIHSTPVSATEILAKLEHFSTRLNRVGFPRGRESDSNCMLAKEAGMHGQVAFH